MPRRLLNSDPHPGPGRRDIVIARSLLAVVGLVCASYVFAATTTFDLGALTTLLARVKSGEATFVEKRRVEMLDRTLESSGLLSFRAPDSFVRETLKPRREKLAVDGNSVTMSIGERSRTMALDASPEASVTIGWALVSRKCSRNTNRATI